MAQVTVQQLAEVVGASVDRLLTQMKDAGLPHSGASEAVSDEELVLHVHDALDELNSKDPIAAEFVKLRYFAGFSITETAQALDVSAPTAYAHWAYAKAMMVRLMSD